MAEVKHELLQMNTELLFIFRELISALIDQPSSWSQHVSDVSSMLRQMQHLLNTLRPPQVSTRTLCVKLTFYHETESCCSSGFSNSCSHDASRNSAKKACCGRLEVANRSRSGMVAIPFQFKG